MDYRFTADRKDDYLHVRIQGENTPATIRRYLDEVLLACIGEACPYVLIEEDLTGERLRIGEIFAIIHDKSLKFRQAIRLIAYVDVKATSPENMRFAEDVAVNRGVTLGVFAAVTDAEKWLRKKLTAPPP